MSGESANIATAGTSRPRPRTNSVLANGAENQLKRKKKKRPHHSNKWSVYSFLRLLDLCMALKKKGVFDNERKQTLGTAAGVMGTTTIFRGKAALGGFTASVAPGESTKSNCNGKAPGPAVPVEKGGET